MASRNTITIYPLYKIENINNVYSTLAPIISALIVIYYFVIRLRRIDGYYIAIIFIQLLVSIISNLYNKGSYISLIVGLYPVIGMFCIINLICEEKMIQKYFIVYMSNIMLILACINLLFMMINDNLFNDYWNFLGMDNQISFTLCIGALFCMLGAEIYNRKWICNIYIFIYIITNIIIWSASGIISTIIIGGYYLLPIVKNIVQNRRYLFFQNIIITFLVFLIWYSFESLDNQIINWFVCDFLKKDKTLTGRTYIWKFFIEKIQEKPILGYGSLIDSNIYNSTNGIRLSAHNKYIDMMYTSGVCYLALLFLLGYVFSYHLNKQENSIAGVLKILAFGISMLMMTEAAGGVSIYIIYFFASALDKKKMILNEGDNYDT